MKRYQVKPQSSNSSQKGSITNPYSQEEYENMLGNGEWIGGYVSGIGYVLGEVVVTPSSHSEGSPSDCSSDSSSNGSSDGSSDSSYDYPQWGDDGSGNQHDESSENINDSQNGQSGNSTDNEETENHFNTVGDGGQVPSNGNSGGQKNFNDVLSPKDFSGYKQTEPKSCSKRCEEMLAKANCELSGKELCITNSNSNGRVISGNSNLNTGIDYINSQLSQGHPVVVVVDYKDGSTTGENRIDKAGDHFVIIVGSDGESTFHYYDPATSNQGRGTSDSNFFYLQNGLLISTTKCTGSRKDYIMSSIRYNN